VPTIRAGLGLSHESPTQTFGVPSATLPMRLAGAPGAGLALKEA